MYGTYVLESHWQGTASKGTTPSNVGEDGNLELARPHPHNHFETECAQNCRRAPSRDNPGALVLLPHLHALWRQSNTLHLSPRCHPMKT